MLLACRETATSQARLKHTSLKADLGILSNYGIYFTTQRFQSRLGPPASNEQRSNSDTMANPRQRNKARSSTTKRHSTNSLRRLHQKSRRTKPMQGPKVLQEGWDKKKTVFQKCVSVKVYRTLLIYSSAMLLSAFCLVCLSQARHRAPGFNCLISLPLHPPWMSRLRARSHLGSDGSYEMRTEM